MLQDKLWNIFPFLIIFYFQNSHEFKITTNQRISTGLDIKLRFCGFKCENDNDNNKKDMQITGYYWRDYFGIIPPDAYPLGNASKDPRTYIGQVYDASRNGSFAVTIFEGTDHVYTVLHGSVVNKTRHVQIFCSMEPEKLVWRKVDHNNVIEEATNRTFVTASYHRAEKNYIHFITSTSMNGVSYAGCKSSLENEMEYVVMNGTAEATNDYYFLLYSKRETESDKTEKRSGSSFSYQYNINVQPGSYIPKFNNRIQLGRCSLTCTNQNNLGTEDKRKIQMSKNSMKYYWKPHESADERERLKAGTTSSNRTLYVGQLFSSINRFDVGPSEGRSVYIYNDKRALIETLDANILSTQQPENFEFVDVTSANFSSLDTSRLIPGGEMDNGTQIFIGRQISKQTIDPGSIRMFNTGPVLYRFAGATLDFQVLMVKDLK